MLTRNRALQCRDRARDEYADGEQRERADGEHRLLHGLLGEGELQRTRDQDQQVQPEQDYRRETSIVARRLLGSHAWLQFALLWRIVPGFLSRSRAACSARSLPSFASSITTSGLMPRSWIEAPEGVK